MNMNMQNMQMDMSYSMDDYNMNELSQNDWRMEQNMQMNSYDQY